MSIQIMPVSDSAYSLAPILCAPQTESSSSSLLFLCVVIGLANLLLSLFTLIYVFKFKTSLQTMENHAYASGRSLITMIANMKTALSTKKNIHDEDDTNM